MYLLLPTHLQWQIQGGGAGGLGPPFQNPAKYCSLKQPDSRTEVWLRKTTVSGAIALTAYTRKLIG